MTGKPLGAGFAPPTKPTKRISGTAPAANAIPRQHGASLSSPLCHCERSEAISDRGETGLLRFARNDTARVFRVVAIGFRRYPLPVVPESLPEFRHALQDPFSPLPFASPQA
jgi:hypothetical protein